MVPTIFVSIVFLGELSLFQLFVTVYSGLIVIQDHSAIGLRVNDDG
jgi:hypothetical protein